MSGKDRILISLGIYRSAEKILPIIPELKKKYEVDLFLFYQMSHKTKWFGDIDLRENVHKMASDLNINIIQGPGENSFRVGPDSFMKRYSFKNHKVMILDDNIAKRTWGTSAVAKRGKSEDCITVGSPHGNHEFDKLNLVSKFDIFDYIFVFGKLEQSLVPDKFKHRLIPGGIPSNDILKEYPKNEEYILVVPGYLPGHNNTGRDGYLSFTEEAFLKSGALSLSEKYNKKILIKEKSIRKNGVHKCLGFLEDKYSNVEVILDIEDDNKMSCDAFISISAPSTLCFKTIQKGIPTVLLKRFGMTGNFKHYKGLCNIDELNIESEIQRQIDEGRDEKFLDDTLEGSVDFSSTQIYVNAIERLMENGRIE